MRAIASAVLFVAVSGRVAAQATSRTVGVFVALADNATQGIVPVPAALGNGDDPERNLYWGAGEGLKGVFDRSAAWRRAEVPEGGTGEPVLRRRVYRHRTTGTRLEARAYRGSAIRRCLTDFEAAVRDGSFDLAVYIGHNGLMEFELPVPGAPAVAGRRSDVIALCCRSEAYFKARIEAAGGRPILLTAQLMYPGSFILEAAVEGWLAGENKTAIRSRAGAAYATNQKLSKRAGEGVFSKLDD